MIKLIGLVLCVIGLCVLSASPVAAVCFVIVGLGCVFGR